MSSENKFGQIPNKPRSKKLRPRIDLTAMVSISFLLIIFFMVTIELSKPKTLELGRPDGGGCGPDDICCYRPDFRRITTLLLDQNNKIIYYRGLVGFPEEKPKIVSYGKNGIRRELLKMNKMVNEICGYDKGAIVIIKPSKKSNYGNLIDILDEINITNISTYAVVDDFTPEELNLLASN